MTGLAISLIFINLVIGFLMAVLLRSLFFDKELPFGKSRLGSSRAGRPDHFASASAGSAQCDPQPERSRPVAASAAIDECSGSVPAMTRGPSSKDRNHSWPSWSDSHQRLQTLKDRMQYALSVTDKRLAKDVAEQLRDWARSWQSRLQNIDGDATEIPAEWRGIDNDSMRVEMCLAQIETSLSNIGEVLSRGELDEIAERVEQEARSLEKALEDICPERLLHSSMS